MNAGGVKNILQAIRKLDCKLIHLSTDYVFDGSAGPYNEEQPVKPINYYGQTKLDGEIILQQSDIPWTIVRTNVLFGIEVGEGPLNADSYLYLITFE